MAVDILQDNIKKIDEAKTRSIRFFLWPEMWKTFDIDLTSHNWYEYKFNKSTAKKIPDTKGIYSFVIKPNVAKHPSCSYLMYIGQTTGQTLRVRFHQYIEELEGKRKSRPKVYYFLNKYKDHLFFACLPLNDSLSPKNVESKLIKAFLPPVNDEDTFPAEVRKIMKAAKL